MRRSSDLREEYLEFIRSYIDENHCAPRLQEIAENFGVTEPTAHKMLSSLQEAGRLTFSRDDVSGFCIRLIEWIGSTAPASEILIAGGIDRYGRLHEFPKKHGHFPLVLPGYNSDLLFALQAWQHIPQADILANDLLIFCDNKQPEIGEICIIPWEKDMLLVRLIILGEDDKFLCEPVCGDEKAKGFFTNLDDKQQIPLLAIDKKYILASAVALKRILAI